MKDVTDFLPIDEASPILVVGLSPSPTKVVSKNSTYARLKRWMEHAGVDRFDFVNLIPDRIDHHLKAGDGERVRDRATGKKWVVALGSIVGQTLYRVGVEHFQLEHPSGRNRNLNDPTVEAQMLDDLKRYLEVK